MNRQSRQMGAGTGGSGGGALTGTTTAISTGATGYRQLRHGVVPREQPDHTPRRGSFKRRDIRARGSGSGSDLEQVDGLSSILKSTKPPQPHDRARASSQSPRASGTSGTAGAPETFRLSGPPKERHHWQYQSRSAGGRFCRQNKRVHYSVEEPGPLPADDAETARRSVSAKLTPPPTSDEEDEEYEIPRAKRRNAAGSARNGRVGRRAGRGARNIISDDENDVALSQATPARSPSPPSDQSIEQLRAIIAAQFDMEILLRHRELRRIEDRIQQAEHMSWKLNSLRNLGTAQGVETVLGPAQCSGQSQAQVQAAQSAATPAISVARRPPRKSSCCHRRSDGKMVKLQCPECFRTNFSTVEGFLSHCKKIHAMHEIGNSEYVLATYTIPYEKSQSPELADFVGPAGASGPSAHAPSPSTSFAKAWSAPAATVGSKNRPLTTRRKSEPAAGIGCYDTPETGHLSEFLKKKRKRSEGDEIDLAELVTSTTERVEAAHLLTEAEVAAELEPDLEIEPASAESSTVGTPATAIPSSVSQSPLGSSSHSDTKVEKPKRIVKPERKIRRPDPSEEPPKRVTRGVFSNLTKIMRINRFI